MSGFYVEVREAEDGYAVEIRGRVGTKRFSVEVPVFRAEIRCQKRGENYAALVRLAQFLNTPQGLGSLSEWKDACLREGFESIKFPEAPEIHPRYNVISEWYSVTHDRYQKMRFEEIYSQGDFYVVRAPTHILGATRTDIPWKRILFDLGILRFDEYLSSTQLKIQGFRVFSMADEKLRQFTCVTSQRILLVEELQSGKTVLLIPDECADLVQGAILNLIQSDHSVDQSHQKIIPAKLKLIVWLSNLSIDSAQNCLLNIHRMAQTILSSQTTANYSENVFLSRKLHKVIETIQQSVIYISRRMLILQKAIIEHESEIYSDLLNELKEKIGVTNQIADDIEDVVKRIFESEERSKSREMEFRAYVLTFCASIVTPLVVFSQLAQNLPNLTNHLLGLGSLLSIAFGVAFVWFNKYKTRNSRL